MVNLLLAAFILIVFVATIWLLVTSPVSIKEQNEMLNDDEVWP